MSHAATVATVVSNKPGFFSNFFTKLVTNKTIIDAAASRIRKTSGRQRGQIPSVAVAVTKDIKSKMIMALMVGTLGTLVLFFFLNASLFVSILVGLGLFVAAPVVLK